jgi:predicted TIM-barrel fold metal-dependent hydrolase
MRIDSHVHLWPRSLLPDEAVRNYLEPIEKAREILGPELDAFLDFYLDDSSPFSDYEMDVSELINTMDCNDIDRAVVLAIDFGLVNEGKITNDEYTEWLFTECSHDDRLIPFISVDPNRGEEGLRMLERYAKRYDPKGIKMYPATGFYPDDRKFDRYWDLVDDLGLVVVTHAGMALPPLDERYCHPLNMARVAGDHPDTKFIIAHLGGKFSSELPALMRDHENVYADCSAMQGWLPSDPGTVIGTVSRFAEEFPERIVYGSDFPLYEMKYSSMLFIRLLTEGEWGNAGIKENLMGRNMARVLGL